MTTATQRCRCAPTGDLQPAKARGKQTGRLKALSEDQARQLRALRTLARVHGLLDLNPTADSTLLASLVAAAGDLVLNTAGETAYQRTVDRFNTMRAQRNGLDRFLY